MPVILTKLFFFVAIIFLVVMYKKDYEEISGKFADIVKKHPEAKGFLGCMLHVLSAATAAAVVSLGYMILG